MKKNTFNLLIVPFVLIFMFNSQIGFSQVGGTLPENLRESDFFTDTSSNVPNNRKVNFINEGGIPNDGVDDSQNLINLIRRLANRGGGVITIPAGEWILGDIFLRSNIHLIFDKDAVVKPFLYAANNKSIFKIGKQNSKSENVSIRTLGGKFTVDMRGIPNLSRITVFNVKEAENFMVINCHVIDQKTIHAVLNCSASKDGNGVFRGPKKALVKNISQVNAHSGYGVIQVRTGEKMLFKNLSGKNGGVTLRLESDDVSASGVPQDIAKFSEIYGYNVKCTNGNAAVMLQPWGAKNGWIDVQKVEAISCKAAVRIDRAYVGLDAPSFGTFDPRSRITDIKCTYGTLGHVNRGSFPWVPCAVRNDLNSNPIPNMENKFHVGPTIAPIFYRASSNTISDPRFYSINLPSENELAANSFNFPANSKIIVRQEDSKTNCPTLSVGSLDEINSSALVFPNPVLNVVNFQMNFLQKDDEVELKIYNINGKLVTQGVLSGDTNFSFTKEALNLNQAGVYLFQFENNEVLKHYGKLVVK